VLEEGEDLIYVKLPSDIHNRYVMLMDAVLSTGNTACKAIKVCSRAQWPFSWSKRPPALLVQVSRPLAVHLPQHAT
jgi:hypothetical protein